MPLEIRPATLRDAPTICEFNRLLALESEGKVLDIPVLAKGVDAALRDPAKGLYWLAVDSGIIKGQIMVTTEWTDWRNGWFWWIQSVYVRAEARRQGVFRALYEYVQDTARRQKVIGLRLYVEEHNLAAQKTYTRLGMEPMGFYIYHRWPLSERGPNSISAGDQ